MKDKNIWIWIVIAVILFIIMISGLGMGGYGMMGFGMGFGLLFMVLFWGLVIWLIYLIIDTPNRKSKDTQRPLEILKKRYARGEITKREFESMKKELEE